MKSVLLCPPTYFDVRDVKNPYMQDADPVDHEKAQDQWEALRRALGDSGLKVETIDPVEDLEDMVFAANQVFVGRHEKIGKFIVPSKMRSASRQREVPFYVQWFRSQGYKVIELDLTGEYLEGQGDQDLGGLRFPLHLRRHTEVLRCNGRLGVPCHAPSISRRILLSPGHVSLPAQ